MTLFAVKGAAGCGKTYRIMEALGAELARSPLREGQRVLAMTFMHGSRRRLDERLTSVKCLRGRFDCVTIHSFAWKLVKRWRSLAASLGFMPLNDDQFNEQCVVAGTLLERPEVLQWVAASYPIILIDEGQDLTPVLLRIVRALEPLTTLMVAADEFQCLVEELRPNPCVAWLDGACEPEVLATVRRTNIPDLLNAAMSIRQGNPPVSRREFKVLTAFNANGAATFLTNAIAWSKRGTMAVITPSLSGGFVKTAIARLGQQACGQQGNGPYAIRWEMPDTELMKELIGDLNLNGDVTIVDAVAAANRLRIPSVARGVIMSLKRRAQTTGIEMCGALEVEGVVRRHLEVRRQHHGNDSYGMSAMTVQQAKNREFDGVVVMWPYTVAGDPEHKRRLLYNAITRARRWCTVIVQGQAAELDKAPFR